MAEDVVDLTEVGGYAQIHDRERAALRSSSAGLVKRHVRWDEAWSGRLPSASRGDAEERSDGRRHERASSARRVRASSPEPLQRPWVGPRSRVPGPPPADVSRRASSQPRSGRLSRDEELFRRDRGALGARFDDDLDAPRPRSRHDAPTAHARPSLTRSRPVGDRVDRASSRRSNPIDQSTRESLIRARLARPVTLSAVLKETPTAHDASKRRISVVETRVSLLDAVPTTVAHNLERLYASRNRLSSLGGVKQFPNLRLLSAGDNPLDDVPDLDALTSLRKLEVLSLERTPVSKLPFYRQHVIARCSDTLRVLDGEPVDDDARAFAASAVRRDVHNLENLMRAAATADKLRRAYRLSLVHEELRQVVFAARGPVSPTSLPGRHESAQGVDVRTWTRLCAPERAMSRSEVSECARRLRARVAAEAPGIRRAVRARGGEPLPDAELWESAYAARAQREQSDAAALAAYLEDRQAAATEASASSRDPFAAALRWGFEAAAAREAEMRADREAALTDMIDAEVAAAHREYAERPETVPFFSRSEFSSDGGHRLREERPAGAGGTLLDEREDDDDEARSRDGARDRWYESETPGLSFDRGDVTYRGRYRRSGRESVSPESVSGAASLAETQRTEIANAPKSRVPWGHGPGSKAEEARARKAAERRTGETRESRVGRVLSREKENSRAPRARSASPSRLPRDPETRAPRTPAHSPPRRRPEPDPRLGRVDARSFHGHFDSEEKLRRSSASSRDDAFGPVDPSAFERGGVYDTLGAEVDALRAALESQTKGEAELLAANALLLKRCEEAEASAEASRKTCAADAARHAEALRDARADAEAAESHARELAAALDETAASADAADARDVASRLARENAERALADAEARVAAERAECASLREALASKLRDEERDADASALSSRSAGRRLIRVWASRTKRNAKLRVLRAVHMRRCLASRFNLWRKRARAQTKLRATRRRRDAAAAVAALRAWRLARLVSEVAACLVRRRALRRWARETARRAKVRAAFAEDGAAAANDAAEPGEAFEAADPEAEEEKEALLLDAAGAGARKDSDAERRLVEAGLADSAREGEADVLLAWRERASSTAMSPKSRRAALDEYADAVLSAARPFAARHARRALAASAMSAWHLAVTRAQQTRLETLVQTCDALGGAAAAAAEEARGVEAANIELREALEAARLAANAESWTRTETETEAKTNAQGATKIALKPDVNDAVDQLAVVESNASSMRADLTAQLERERAARRVAEDEAKLLRVRVGGESGETRRAEAVAAAAAGEAAAWRSAAVTNEAAVRRALESFVEWGAEMETEREAFGRTVGLSTGKKASVSRRAKLSERFSSFAFRDPDETETTKFGRRDGGASADSPDSSGSAGSSSSSAKTPTSGMDTRASSFGSLDRALRVFGLGGSGSAEKEKKRDAAEAVARLPKPARASFAFLKTHARLAAALRRCGEAETSRRAEAEAAHAGAAQAAEEARARVAAATEAATEAAAFAVEAEAAATILQSAVRGHLARKRSKRSSVLKLAEAFSRGIEKEVSGLVSDTKTVETVEKPAPAPVASSPRTANRDDDETFESVTRETDVSIGRYDESTQTPPESEHRATQTPPRRPSPAASSPTTAGSRTTRNPFSSAKRMLREGRVVVTPTPKKSTPGKAPWRPPSNNIFDSPLSPPPSPKRP